MLKNKKIINIKKIGKRKVYSLEVLPNHNFLLSNGILSHNCLDCQSPQEVKGLVQGSEDFLLLFKMTSWRDKSEACDEMKKERRMRQDQINELAFLEKGQCMVAETGKVVRKIQILLPRSMYWKKEYPNFYKRLWENYGGEWMSIENTKESITKSFNDCLNKYKEIEENEKTKKKPKINKELIPINNNLNEVTIKNNNTRKLRPLPF